MGFPGEIAARDTARWEGNDIRGERDTRRFDMPAMMRRELVSIALQLICGVTMGSILMVILRDAINPLIIYVIIIATIIAILDFADYLPAFSIAFFTGYVVEFLWPLAGVFGGLEVPALVLSLVGMAVVVAMKLQDGRTGDAL